MRGRYKYSIEEPESRFAPTEYEKANPRSVGNKILMDYLDRQAELVWNGIIFRSFPLINNEVMDGWGEWFSLDLKIPEVLSVHGDENSNAVIMLSVKTVPQKRRVVPVQTLVNYAGTVFDYGNLKSPDLHTKKVESVFRVALAALHD